ncbi:hypothetical protein [Bartonella melophagi]|uniref:Uncharacterized protein n=1 Tax=Bartonella melophagi K-2C TaxID=1094557 RepID=J0ZRP9_9HYPH|nr:hypothetical protein [Bartonella melophagi]EJF91383.1 hypothetical protein ME3_00449 [Bartonella melophagi K-2C]
MRKKIEDFQRRLLKVQIDDLNSDSSNQLLNELRKETKELAAILAAQIALKEGEDSPINTLIKNSKSKSDLASYIRQKTIRTT